MKPSIPFLLFLSVIFSDCANITNRGPKIYPFKLNHLKYVNPDDVPPLFGAGFAQEGNFTYAILVMYSPKEDPEEMVQCTATLIKEDWALTAANCFGGNLKPKARSVILAGGTVDLNSYVRKRIRTPFCNKVNDVEDVQERRANYIYVNELYNAETKEHDIALIRLRKPFHIGRTISMISLSYDKMKSSMSKCTILRWGMPNNGQNIRLMYSDDMIAQTVQEGCENKKEGNFICLKRDTAICHGETGSPLICSGKVWGVASHLYSFKDSQDCEDTLEEYYTEVFTNFVWLMETLAKPPEIHPDLTAANDKCFKDSDGAASRSIPSVFGIIILISVLRCAVKL